MNYWTSILMKYKKEKITVLVGNNGVGKSLIRKQLHFKWTRKYGERKSYIRAVSMQQRTENRSADWGALGSMLHDDETSPTSLWTYYLKMILKSIIMYLMNLS